MSSSKKNFEYIDAQFDLILEMVKDERPETFAETWEKFLICNGWSEEEFELEIANRMCKDDNRLN